MTTAPGVPDSFVPIPDSYTYVPEDQPRILAGHVDTFIEELGR
jgi:hypothetical protein